MAGLPLRLKAAVFTAAIGFISFSSVSSLAAAKPGSGVTKLSDAFNQMLSTNPSLLSLYAGEKALHHGIAIARAAYLPKLSIDYSIGVDDGKNTTEEAGGSKQLSTVLATDMGASINQLVFDGAATIFRIRGAKQSFHESVFLTNSEIDSLLAQTAKSYINIIRDRKLVTLAESNNGSHKRTYRQMKLRFDQGAGRKSELSLAKGRLAKSAVDYYEKEGELAVDESNYLQLVGSPAAKFVMPRLPANAIPKTLGDALALAEKDNPILKASKANFKSRGYALKAAKGDAYSPKIKIVLDAYRLKNTNTLRGETEDYSAMAQASFNLFNGGADFATIRQNAEYKVASEENIAEIKRTLVSAIRNDWHNIQTQKKREKAITQHVASAKEVVQYYKQEFKLGKRSLLNVLDAESELYRANVSLVDARAQIAAGNYMLLSDAGQIVHYIK